LKFLDSDSNILVVFLIIVFVVIVIISIIAVLLFIIKNKLKNKRQESSRKQITGIDPRFGSIDSKTNITINVSEISIASNASNSSRISGFFEPTGAHIRKTIPVKDQQK
jgi:flagellar biosynthesis/type III secretory pathway M-ring protein FliF/YscJ